MQIAEDRNRVRPLAFLQKKPLPPRKIGRQSSIDAQQQVMLRLNGNLNSPLQSILSKKSSPGSRHRNMGATPSQAIIDSYRSSSVPGNDGSKLFNKSQLKLPATQRKGDNTDVYGDKNYGTQLASNVQLNLGNARNSIDSRNASDSHFLKNSNAASKRDSAHSIVHSDAVINGEYSPKTDLKSAFKA